MVLSRIFKKKRPDEKQPSRKVAPETAEADEAFEASILGKPTTSAPPLARAPERPVAPAVPPRPARDVARDLADETTRKIDQIESDMSRESRHPSHDLFSSLSSHPNGGYSGSDSRVSGASLLRTDAGTIPSFIASDAMPTLGHSTDILLGDSMLSNAVELSDSISNPAMEEAAILFADGEAGAAANGLKESIAPGAINHDNIHAWLMLLELYRAEDDQENFDSLAIDYALQFDNSAPPWAPEPESTEAEASELPRPAREKHASRPSRERVVVAFKGPLNTSITPDLDRLKRLTPRYHTLYVDFSKVTSVEATGAKLILRVLEAFCRSNHVLVVDGAPRLLDRVVAASEKDPTRTSPSIWTLMLDLNRLLERRVEFERRSVEFGNAFNTPVPYWEPYPAAVRVGSAQDEDPAAAGSTPSEKREGPLPGNTIAMTGELVGTLEQELGRLSNFAKTVDRVCIDCSRLSRIDFAAAGALLNWAVAQQQHHKTIEFRRVNHLVGTLLIVMGIHEVAQIDRH